jgi:hypothetical protein
VSTWRSDRAGASTGRSDLSGSKVSILTGIKESSEVAGLSAAYFEVGLVVAVRLLACDAQRSGACSYSSLFNFRVSM